MNLIVQDLSDQLFACLRLSFWLLLLWLAHDDIVVKQEGRDD
jgi:hypothetical protein